MASSKSNDYLSYGITFLILGVLYLLDYTKLLAKIPYGESLISIGAFFLIAGVIFIITQPKKALGWIFLVIGIIFNADLLLGWIISLPYLVVPIALMIIGIGMVLISKKKV